MTQIKINPLEQLKAKDYWKVDKYINGGYFANSEDPQDVEILEFISDFTGVEIDVLYRQPISTLREMFNAINDNLNIYKFTPPKEEIKVNGQVYTLRSDFLSLSVGWWEHMRNLINAKADPVDKLGLLYIEKGLNYAEIDKFKNILNPTDKRTKILSEAMTLEDFTNLNAFFLNILLLHSRMSSEVKAMLSKPMSRRMLKKKLNLITLSKQLTD